MFHRLEMHSGRSKDDNPADQARFKDKCRSETCFGRGARRRLRGFPNIQGFEQRHRTVFATIEEVEIEEARVEFIQCRDYAYDTRFTYAGRGLQIRGNGDEEMSKWNAGRSEVRWRTRSSAQERERISIL